MYIKTITGLLFLCLTACFGCRAGNGLKEDLEHGKKDAYSAAGISLASGRWLFNDALIGNSDKDRKNGKACIRIRNNGFAAMEYDIQANTPQVSVIHAVYGSDKEAYWTFQFSTNGGLRWEDAAGQVQATTVLSKAVFHIDHKGPIRFRILKTGGGRLNIDDITTGKGNTLSQTTIAKASRDDHLLLGNPTAAGSHDRDNYLLIKPQYALSYNNKKGIANWVSWHLSTAWKGDAERCNCFAPDPALPAGFLIAMPSQYIGTGFDKGHLCPSDDRDGDNADNTATFLMPNIAPQAPNLNRDTWEKLESYCRRLVSEGNELYIIAGTYGKGGEGEKGKKDLVGAAITVPARFWKVIVVLPNGDNDISRINARTRIIAVDIPNQQNASAYQWAHYRTTVDAIEHLTGYDLLTRLSVKMQATLESRLDKGPIR